MRALASSTDVHTRIIEAHRLPLQGRHIAIQVLSRRDVKHLRPEAPHIVISIADRPGVHPTLPDVSTRLGALQVAFDDVVPVRKGELVGGKRAMDTADARSIREFVAVHREKAALIVVHCEAGKCRSPAVAAALWRWIEGTRGPFFETFRPNPHVYRTMSDALAE